jgi:hypothetical protein
MSEGTNKLSDYSIVAYQSNDGKYQFIQIGKIKYRVVDDNYLQSLETKLKITVEALEFYSQGAQVIGFERGERAREVLKQIKGEET